MNFADPLEAVAYGNSISRWLTALGTLLVVFGIVYLLRSVVIRRLSAVAQRTDTIADDIVVEVLRRTRYLLYLWLALVVALRMLAFPAGVGALLGNIAAVALAVQMGLWVSWAIDFWMQRYTAQRAGDGASVTTVRALTVAARAFVWLLLFLLVLENVGFDVTTLIAGLGITGIAVALAVQNILGDLFGAVSIVVDKPFVLGDFIAVDQYLGTVERIGMKTTRLRSLSGEQIIFSNADLLKSRIRNYKRMYERRVEYNFGVSYDTTPEQVERIPVILREAVQAQRDTRFDRSHVNAFVDSALNVQTVYYVTTADYNRYMDIQQAINLTVMRRFREEGISFAFPMRRVIVSDGALPSPDSAASPAREIGA
ncbi:MAG TPA: mechanosensitive ion channel family protein [Gemmatimonadaceae bacterium]|nr:mechanosensitive ion channel family protein [Gemmatimonadaceae bacterium]